MRNGIYAGEKKETTVGEGLYAGEVTESQDDDSQIRKGTETHKKGTETHEKGTETHETEGD
jgi:hypothetical protein